MSKYNSITISFDGITKIIPEFFDCANCGKKTSHLDKHMTDDLDFVCNECHEKILESMDDEEDEYDLYNNPWGEY